MPRPSDLTPGALWGLVAVFCLVPIALAASGADDLGSLANRGGIGLLELPTARMAPVGTVVGGVTITDGVYRHGFLAIQPWPWLATGIRRSRRVGGPDGWPDDADVDLRLRLSDETRWRPALALGLEGLASGRFGSEYLVASKRWFDLDFALGLGWGRLGEAGHFANPLSLLGGRYDRDRDPLASPGGPPRWFSGRDVAVFGGVEYHTALPGFSLKLEYTPDLMRADRQLDPALEPGLAINAGLAYRPWRWLDLGLGIERGRDLMARLALRPQAGDLTLLALPVEAPPPVHQPRPASERGRRRDFAEAGLNVRAVTMAPTTASAWLDLADGDDPAAPARPLGRAVRVLANQAPAGVEQLTVTLGRKGLDGPSVAVMRGDLERASHFRGSAEELWENAVVLPAGTVRAPADGSGGTAPTRWTGIVTPLLQQSPFEAAAGYVYRASLDAGIEAEPWRGLIFAGGVRINLSDNLDRVARVTPPASRPVRSDLWAYTADRLSTLDHLSVSWLASPSSDWHLRVSAGHFEEQYGGLGGEILYRPGAARWALGGDFNQVWKRPPEEPLRLDPTAGVATGHATLYYEMPDQASHAALRVGRFLGGDFGGSVEAAHLFSGGVRLSAYGAWAGGGWVRPNAAQTRFDYGLQLSLPLGRLAFLPEASRAEVASRTLMRDAGQRLTLPQPLYDVSDPISYGRLVGTWPEIVR